MNSLSSIAIAVLLSMSGCAARQQGAALSDEEAAALALRLANREAERRFQAAPFTRDSGYLKAVDGQWCWQALATAKSADLVAKVTFNWDGTRPQVYVDMQFSAVIPKPESEGLPKEGPKGLLPLVQER